MDMLKEIRKVGQINLMFAIAQSGCHYHFLNWIPSESGPLVINYGFIKKELVFSDFYNHDYLDVLDEIFSKNINQEPICSFSLDRNNVLFSSCFSDGDNKDLIDWHMDQSIDKDLSAKLDYYHYPMKSKLNCTLNIGVSKNIRQSFQVNMRLLKAKMSSLSVGIFSAEIGARKWMKANNNPSYIIWKIGKKKIDEILFIKNNELTNYYSFQRKGDNSKIIWNYGDEEVAESIMQEIINLNKNSKKFNFATQVYVYTTEGSLNDVKSINSLGVENLSLLNPLYALEKDNNEKYDEYATLPLAETGNSFGGVDV
tara:strand:+ start:2701 stop:3636 length:936 start_codon:yes stop_codon:yes gene_type:complete